MIRNISPNEYGNRSILLSYRSSICKYLRDFILRSELTLFQHFYNSFDFFQDDLDIEIVELKNNRITFRVKNSDFLEPSGKFLYFFYIACGITEGIYLQNLNMEINCEIEEISISDETEVKYIDISLSLL